MRYCVEIILSLTYLFIAASAININGLIPKSLSRAQCGTQAGGILCPEPQCCSKWGFCGFTWDYCNSIDCQSQCSGWDSGDNIADIFPESLFDKILSHRNDENCTAKGFYTYDAFLEAKSLFYDFGSRGNNNTRKREIAAFLAHTSYLTSGGSPDSSDGPYTRGYCLLETVVDSGEDYCVSSDKWPCVAGKNYHARGPMMIIGNEEYGKVGKAIELDLLKDPDLVTKDPVVSFMTALYLWMTPQKPNQPSCHDVIIGNWNPSQNDKSALRLPGFGMTTNIIDGTNECGYGKDEQSENRIGFYKKYCDILGVGYGDNLDCEKQMPYFSAGLSLQKI